MIKLAGGGNITESYMRSAKNATGVEIAALYGTHAERAAQLSGEH